MKVIGAGLPRTGTLTQKVALEMLGLGPCYHMVNVLGDLSLVQLWRDALDGNPDWEQIFDGFQSTVDWPGGFFYRELADVYPEAKVVLSVRDPEAWERSMRKTVWGVVNGENLIRHLSSAQAAIEPQWQSYLELIRELLWRNRGTLADRHEDTDGLIESMQRFEQEVRQAIPAERLLVWDVREGWEPLCEFLGTDVPGAPLPHLNDSEEFEARIIEMALGELQEWWQREQRERAGNANRAVAAR